MIKIIKPSIELIDPPKYERMLKKVELCGRVCWKSEGKITKNSAEKFVKMLIKNKHFSVLESESITVRFMCSVNTARQLVRHRIGAFSEMSQRYCNFSKKDELEVICPQAIKETVVNYDKNTESTPFRNWFLSVTEAFDTYKYLIKEKIKSEDARSVLPGCSKTEIIATFNIRMWRHVIQERALNKRAQEEIRSIMTQVFQKFIELYPAFFEDLTIDSN